MTRVLGSIIPTLTLNTPKHPLYPTVVHVAQVETYGVLMHQKINSKRHLSMFEREQKVHFPHLERVNAEFG